MAKARTPEIMADAAHAIFVRDARECTGNFFIDDEVLEGDLDRYRAGAGGTEDDLLPDFFI